VTKVIDKKIKGFSVVKPDTAPASAPPPATPVAAAPASLAAPARVEMHESIERPEALVGSTYKVKSPSLDHALYVTINDIVLNAGTEHAQRRPFEIFINSKNMEQFQWIVALTRIMSAVFRKGGDVAFLVEEMKAVFDPRGGYFKPGGVFMPSIIAEIGAVLERHLKDSGLLDGDAMSDETRRFLAAKRAEYDAGQGKGGQGKDTSQPVVSATDASLVAAAGTEGSSFPPTATMCPKCSTKAMIMMDGCQTCLNCGHSKCG